MIHVIGGNGFIGTHLAEALRARSVEYKVFDKVLCGDQFCDVTNVPSLKALARCDILINLAAEHRDDIIPESLYYDVNVTGAENVCDYCREKQVRTIVFTSSVAVYGFAPEDTGEDGELNPFNAYGRSKMEAEAVYLRWLNEDIINRTLVIVRPTAVFGEGNRGNVYNLVKRISKKQFLLFGDGLNKKSLAYVGNVAEFIGFCTALPTGQHIFNYVDKPDFNMRTLVQHCRRTLFGKNDAGVSGPRWVGLTIGAAFDVVAFITGKTFPVSSIRIKKFMETTVFSTSAGEVGFTAKYDLRQALEQTIRHEFLPDKKYE